MSRVLAFAAMFALGVTSSFAQDALTPPAMVPLPPNLPMPVECRWPEAALKQNAEGDTVLGFRVGTDGKAKDITILQPSGNQDLDATSIACLQVRTYKPATKNGQPIEVPWHTKFAWHYQD